jgi:hypothetical protein
MTPLKAFICVVLASVITSLSGLPVSRLLVYFLDGDSFRNSGLFKDYSVMSVLSFAVLLTLSTLIAFPLLLLLSRIMPVFYILISITAAISVFSLIQYRSTGHLTLRVIKFGIAYGTVYGAVVYTFYKVSRKYE